jgi:hypothetical protein
MSFSTDQATNKAKCTHKIDPFRSWIQSQNIKFPETFIIPIQTWETLHFARLVPCFASSSHTYAQGHFEKSWNPSHHTFQEIGRMLPESGIPWDDRRCNSARCIRLLDSCSTNHNVTSKSQETNRNPGRNICLTWPLSNVQMKKMELETN